ncbi:MAG: inner membrane protein YpjD [marine bacterium B5-7]|nr:MAG: inner membrane protein YpjD [marine bacterium B5-7]
MLSVLADLWVYAAIALYAWVIFLLFRDLDESNGRVRPLVYALLLLAAGCHAFALISTIFGGATIDLDLGNALSLTAWVVVVLFILALARQPLATLGLIIVPFALIDVLIARFFPGPPMPITDFDAVAVGHTLISIVAYGLFALSFCQALILMLQDWYLQNKRSGSFFHSLPPLETMERILFQLIAIGFALLTISLISGSVFSQELFGSAFKFNHHVVLSMVAWVTFAILIGGRMLWGWRGRVAAVWTIAGFLILVLAYFGSRFVLEVILHRSR